MEKELQNSAQRVDDAEEIGRLVEDFVARLRGRQQPDLAQILAAHPHLSGLAAALSDAGALEAARSRPPLFRELTLGERFADYEICGLAGRGGMGAVYYARDHRLGRRVALKVLHRSPSDVESKERFLREARASAALQHTNIVPVFEVGEVDGVPYYVMLAVNGASLRDRLDAERRSSGATTVGAADSTAVVADWRHRKTRHQRAARIIAEIASAAAYAHGVGIIHRDIKPANILLGTDGDPNFPWLADFGLARIGSSDLTSAGDAVGTPAYMAPEQFNNMTSPLSDVWSIGATLYEMLTLSPPFPGDRDTLRDRIRTLEPVAPRARDSSIPRDLETITLRALAKEPTRRYSSAAALAEDLNRFLRDEPIQARPPGPFELAWRKARRHPLTTMLGCLLLTALIGGVSAWAYQLKKTTASELRRAKDVALGNIQQFLNRGAWGEVLRAVERLPSLPLSHDDAIAVQLARARALLGLNHSVEAERQLDTLDAQLPAPSAASAKLRGDVLLGRDHAAAQASYRRAATLIAADPAPLKAERRFLAALDAKDLPSWVNALQDSLREDPYQQSQQAALGFGYLALGRATEARQQAAIARLLFPEDRTFAVLEAMTLVCQGDERSAERTLNDAGLDEAELKRTSRFLRVIAIARRLAPLLLAGEAKDPHPELILLLPDLRAAIEASGDAKIQLNSALPLLPESAGRYLQQLDSIANFNLLTTLHDAMNPESLRRLTDVCPEGTLLTMLAVARQAEGPRPGQSPADLARECRQTLLRALDAPASSAIRPAILANLMAFDWALASPRMGHVQKDDPKMLAELRAHAIQLAQLPPPRMTAATRVTVCAGAALAKAGPAARVLLAEWQEVFPTDLSYIAIRAQVAADDGLPEEARAEANYYLKTSPNGPFAEWARNVLAALR